MRGIYAPRYHTPRNARGTYGPPGILWREKKNICICISREFPITQEIMGAASYSSPHSELPSHSPFPTVPLPSPATPPRPLPYT